MPAIVSVDLIEIAVFGGFSLKERPKLPPQGLFVSVSLRPGSAGSGQNFGARVIRQFAAEFVAAFGLSLLLLTTSIRSPLSTAAFLGLAGLIAGIETHFSNWN